MFKLDIVKEQIRQQLLLSTVIERLTGQRMHKGRILCPFHNDTHPSLIITDSKGLFNCPACNTGGDIYKFVMLYLGLNFKDAITCLDKEFDLNLLGQRISVKQQIALREQEKKRKQQEYIRVKQEKEYNNMCQDYRICIISLDKLEPWTDLWCYYLEQKAQLDCRFNLLEEGGSECA